MAQVATKRWVGMGQQFTRRSDAMHFSPFSGSGTLCASTLIVDHGLEGSLDNNADVEGATGGCVSEWQGTTQAYMAIQPRDTAATPIGKLHVKSYDA